MPNAIDDDLESWVEFDVSAKDVPSLKNLPSQEPSYLSSALQWATNFLPSGKTVLFSVSKSTATLLGLNAANEGIRFAEAIANLYENDSAENRAHLSTLLSEHAPHLVSQVSDVLSHQAAKMVVRKMVVENLVPFGLQTAASSVTNKVTDSILAGLNLDSLLENLFSADAVQQLIAKGVALSVNQGVDSIAYLSAPVEVTNPSVLDEATKVFFDDQANCVRNKTLLEIEQAYLRATLIKHLAEAVGAQVEELIKRHASASPALEVQAGLFIASKAIRASVEQALKTQNGTAVSVDKQLENAKIMMEQHFGSDISLLSCFKDIYLTSNVRQTEYKNIKLVTSGLRSALVDNDKPYLIKMREEYVKAYQQLQRLTIDQLQVSEYVGGLRGEISFEQTKLAQEELMRIERATNDSLRTLEINSGAISRPIGNLERKQEYVSSWASEIHKLSTELRSEHKDILDSETFVAYQAKQQQEMELQAKQKRGQSSDNQAGYFGWAYNKVTNMATGLFSGSDENTPKNRKKLGK